MTANQFNMLQKQLFCNNSHGMRSFGKHYSVLNKKYPRRCSASDIRSSIQAYCFVCGFTTL
jgi:ribosomal protein L37E